jgi:hypothetical protein
VLQILHGAPVQNHLTHMARHVATLLSSPTIADEIAGGQHATCFPIGAAQSDATCAFSHCSLSIGHTDGKTLWIGLYRNETVLVLLSSPKVR